MDKKKIIDVIATAQKHVDQGISFEIGITSNETTRDLIKYYFRIWIPVSMRPERIVCLLAEKNKSSL